MKHFARYLLGGLALLWSCGDEDLSKHPDSEYVPLRTGFYQIYDVEKTVYSELNPPESFVYELKTEVVDSFPNQEDGYTFVIYRSTRATENDPWEFQEAWSARVNSYQAISNEGNISFVRIGFPAVKNNEWNGNALNSLEEDFYKLEQAGGEYEIDSESFKDVLVINQEDRSTELVKDDREEVYARNVGLIYKKNIVVNYCDDDECFGQEIIKDGIEYWQTLKEYGQN